MERKELYTEASLRAAKGRRRLWRIFLWLLVCILVIGMFLLCRNIDPIEPGRRQLYATVFLTLVGWIGIFLIFHGLLPAIRELRHVQRMLSEEGETQSYTGRLRLGEKSEEIRGSIRVRRVTLLEESKGRGPLLWERWAGDFPGEGLLCLSIRNGFVAAWQEVEHGEA